ncbi:S-adenosylmethionine mitochondrial carrier protein homolog isoform X4 [Formica exsecta]|uniref:S-adenosylmethionine mitochondrial carrier protein homolog isoform X4 n=1 Tax=Formica exsecta TaxID=72781 RepID=UPI001143FA4C|nr:S-adenosylmethionine mitochondrial carrier protein homolog isoform X4 [Formica exsecta]
MTKSERKTEATGVRNVFITSLIAGGTAGTFVDITLFPLDTLKTRLQSAQGFLNAGGFTGLYRGIYPVIIGSAPTVEVIKQRKQALIHDKESLGLKLLYRGYWSTVLRDTPFSIVQFPLWEYLKKLYSFHIRREIYPVESAICGAISGSISATVTTPLDVAKTRIMLANRTMLSSQLTILNILHDIYIENGFRGLFAGLGPRITWITLGGFIFFGVYEEARVLTKNIFDAKIITTNNHKQFSQKY